MTTKTLLISLLGAAALLISSTALAGPKSAHPAVQKVRAFVAAGDRQNARELKKVLGANFQVDFSVGPDGDVIHMDRAGYLGAVKAKKIGGDSRKLTVRSVDMNGKFVVVRAVLTSKKSTFESIYTLVKGKSGWRLAHDMSVFTPKS